MRRYMIVGLGFLLGLGAAWAGENAVDSPDTQPATKASFDAPSMAKAYATTIQGVLPKGWSVQANRDIITIRRDEKVQGVHASPVAPAPNEITWTATIEVRVGPRISMAQYCRMASENEAVRKAALARRPNYDPVDNPIRLPHSLPTHLDGQSSLWISGGYLDKHFEFKSKDVAQECRRVYEATKGLFRPYGPPYLLWGSAVNGLEAGLDLERPAEEAKGKLHLLFRLRNSGDKPVRVLRLSAQAHFWGENLPIEVKVGRDILKYPGPVLEPPPPPAPQQYAQLAPGKMDSVEVEMNPAHWGIEDLSKATAAFIFTNTNEKVEPGPGWPVITGLWTGTARSARIPLARGAATQPAKDEITLTPDTAALLCITPKWMLWQTHELIEATARHRAQTFVIRFYVQPRGKEHARLVRTTQDTNVRWNATVLDDGTSVLNSCGRLVWVSPDGKVRSTPELYPTLDGKSMEPLGLYPDGVILRAMQLKDEPVRAWFVPIQKGALVEKLKVALTDEKGFRFARAPVHYKIARSGDEFAWSDDAGLHVVNVATGARRRWPGITRPVQAFDGKTVVAGDTAFDLAGDKEHRLAESFCFLAVRNGIGYTVRGVQQPIGAAGHPESLHLTAVDLRTGKTRILASWANADICYGADAGPMGQAFDHRVKYDYAPTLLAEDPEGLTIWDGTAWRQFKWLTRIDQPATQPGG